MWWQVPGSRGRAPMLVITRGLIIVTGVIRLECPDPSLSSQLGKNKSLASRQSIVYHNSLTRWSSKRNFWGGGPDLCFSFKIYIIYFFSKIIFEVIPTSIFPPLSYWQKIKDRSGTIADSEIDMNNQITSWLRCPGYFDLCASELSDDAKNINS